jgi:pimeloyl-ACP methyl ester carboxylesterase
VTFEDVTFQSQGIAGSAWHFRGDGDALTGPGGRPIVVMAHGFGGTKDAGLKPVAERISAAGIDVLAFDFRGFGASDGQPRQWISVDAAKSLPGIDGAAMDGGGRGQPNLACPRRGAQADAVGGQAR